MVENIKAGLLIEALIIEADHHLFNLIGVAAEAISYIDFAREKSRSPPRATHSPTRRSSSALEMPDGGKGNAANLHECL